MNSFSIWREDKNSGQFLLDSLPRLILEILIERIAARRKSRPVMVLTERLYSGLFRQ